ncbi:MAG: hypothetical protein HYU02_01135 [Thaumarchaeota archaeon]|nr:hypothetical protein [Nitrososphaerota archaeon]
MVCLTAFSKFLYNQFDIQTEVSVLIKRAKKKREIAIKKLADASKSGKGSGTLPTLNMTGKIMKIMGKLMNRTFQASHLKL